MHMHSQLAPKRGLPKDLGGGRVPDHGTKYAARKKRMAFWANAGTPDAFRRIF